HTLKVWELESGKCLYTLEGHSDRVNAVALSQDEQTAVSASEDHTLKVWDIKKGELLHTHSGLVTHVKLAQDGRIAVFASNYNTLKVLDIKRGEVLYTLVGHSFRVTDVALANGLAISSSYDNTVKVWDIKKEELLYNLVCQHFCVNAVALTQDGFAISASDDYTMKLWDIEKGELLDTSKNHSDWIAFYDFYNRMKEPYDLSVSFSNNKLQVYDIHTSKLSTFFADANITTCISASGNKTIVAGDASGQMHFLRLME
ncbi:MAG: WD40 repeat domain-containing protein, partial [Candidatus Brocadiae bacterium]|nr:WD40 repeat domain-containing protein [Candidatus Brocadiia bacterium]